eukprot:COSAG02_NODE_210_length_28878_cov_133.787136_22_plen_33_part_00
MHSLVLPVVFILSAIYFYSLAFSLGPSLSVID